MLKEFKEFAVGGNVLDMAVGLIIGAAFGTVVKSLVDNVLMPPIGKLMNGVDFSKQFVNLTEGGSKVFAEAEAAGNSMFKYGQFIQDSLSFFITAFAIFIVVKKVLGSVKKKEEVVAAGPTQEELLGEIRDLLKTR